MPANLTPEYKKAEEAFRRAREPRERLQCLREMLRTIPKHKGTDHLQADIKSRIKQLSEELAGPRKGGARGGPSYAVRPEGAAQVVLVGPPNAGKSALHARLTGSRAEIGPYPFTTREPMPGMLAHADVHFQLVDLPPVTAEYLEPWFGTAVQHADAALLVVDLSDPECLDHVVAIRARLDERKIVLDECWPGLGGNAAAAAAPDGEDALPDPFTVRLPTLLVANKCDLDPDPDEVRVLEELLGVRYPAVAVSAESGAGLAELGPLLFRGLQVVRVYTKTPGRPAERDKPFTVRRGATVADVARRVHKEVARELRYARVWGEATFDGQQVGPEHPVSDGDVVELHGR